MYAKAGKQVTSKIDQSNHVLLQNFIQNQAHTTKIKIMLHNAI